MADAPWEDYGAQASPTAPTASAAPEPGPWDDYVQSEPSSPQSQEQKIRTNDDGSTDYLGDDGKWYIKTGPPESTVMSLWNDAKRGLGLAARAGADAFGQATDLLATPLKLIDKLDQFITPGRIRGNAFEGSYADKANALADRIGLPKPEGAAERINNAALSGALFSGAGGAGALASGALSGVGLQGSREAGASPAVQIGAALAGGMLPAGGAALARVAAPLAEDVANATRRARDSLTTDGAQSRASAALHNAALRPVGDIVEDIAARGVSASGAQPTLAEVARDAGIAGFQRGHGNTDMAAAAELGARGQANAIRRTEATQESLGQGSPQAIQDVAQADVGAAEQATAAQQAARQVAVEARLAELRANATTGANDAETVLGGARESIGPIVDRTATGGDARQAFSDAYQAARAKTREAYSAPALVEPQPIDIPQSIFLKMRDTADRFYGDGGGEIPARLKAILEDEANPEATTRTLTNIDRRLADFAGEAKMGGARSDAAFAESLRGDLQSFINTHAPQEYRDALSNAKAVRAEQGRIFETGDAPKAFAKDRFNNPVVGDTTVPSRIVRPGAPGGDTADGLIAAVGPEQAESVARQELRRQIEEGGVQTEAQARSIATRFGEVAKRFPGLQSDLEQLQNAGRGLDRARVEASEAARAAPTRDEVDAIRQRAAVHDALLSSPLGKVANDAVDPSSFVAGLLRRTDSGRQLRQLAGQVQSRPAALAGLRRAFGDYIADAGKTSVFTAAGDRVPSIAGTRKAIDTVLSRAGSAITDAQRIALKRIGQELESASFASSAARPAGSETALNQTFKINPIVAGTPHVGQAASIISKLVSVLGNDKEVKQVITHALLDPDFAATLLKRPTPAHWLAVKRSMARSAAPSAPSHLATLGGIIVARPAFADEARLLQTRAANMNAAPLAASVPVASDNINQSATVPPQESR